ncbi:MAG: glycosyltransferase family 1 protein [Aristaeellaceae bacterium]
MGEPIRVLNVVGRMDRGGIETLIMNVYRHIDRTKVQFDFLAHYGKENADYNAEIRALGGHIYEMPVIKTTEKTYYRRLFTYIRALKQFFRAHPEFHVVHGHMTNTAAIYMPIAKKYGSVTTCIAHSHLAETQHTVSPLTAIGTDILRRPLRYCATDYFACSESAARWLFKDEDIRDGKVTIIKNGIDTDSFDIREETRREMRAKLGLGDKTAIGHVGRFFPPKNHDFLIDVFTRYHQLNPNSVLMLVGDGELREKMEAKVASLSLGDAVMFMGVRSDVNQLLQAMDLFLMPSHYEGLPVAGIEAQATGIPMLVSDVITRELDVTGHVHFMSLDTPPEAWAQRIGEILNGFERKSAKAQIVEAGYDIGETAKFLEEFYLKRHQGER